MKFTTQMAPSLFLANQVAYNQLIVVSLANQSQPVFNQAANPITVVKEQTTNRRIVVMQIANQRRVVYIMIVNQRLEAVLCMEVKVLMMDKI